MSDEELIDCLVCGWVGMGLVTDVFVDYQDLGGTKFISIFSEEMTVNLERKDYGYKKITEFFLSKIKYYPTPFFF